MDLGQQTVSAKEETVLDRKRKRWAERNKDKDPEENPFLRAIRPDQENFGAEDERGDELRQRLSNLEFGNFPGYFNYRNKAAAASTDAKVRDATATKNDADDNNPSDPKEPTITSGDDDDTPAEEQSQPLESGLSDERLKFFKPEWFARKEVLDIGCNRGHITYAIARLFGPKSIVGIDIDLKMINMANKDLHLHLEDGIIGKNKADLREQAVRQRLEGGDTVKSCEQFPVSIYISDGPLSQDGSENHQSAAKKSSADFGESSASSKETEDKQFPNNIIFVEHNYVLARDELVDKQRPYFDTIVCLSVTKWIHLNYCDAGLKRFFRRIHRHLRPGGLLVLEAQPFDNYGRRKKLSDRLRANYYSIQFKPDQFDGYLLSEEVGFEKIVYESVTDHRCVGFKRPLKVFLK